jgi:hypothetical protein
VDQQDKTDDRNKGQSEELQEQEVPASITSRGEMSDQEHRSTGELSPVVVMIQQEWVHGESHSTMRNCGVVVQTPQGPLE